MKISFAIPAYNEEENIARCVKSILAHRTPDLLEVIVVDNNSTDRTAEIAGAIEGVRVVKEKNKGLLWARERGFLSAKGDLIANVDADTELPDGWFERVQKEFAADPNLVCLSGPQKYNDVSWFYKKVSFALWYMSAPIAYRIAGYMAHGGNFVVKRSALEKIGGFDTTINFHGEDTDIARRLSKVGKVKFSMSFFIYGSGRRIIEEGLVKSYVIYGLNFLWVAIKHKPFSNSYKDIRI